MWTQGNLVIGLINREVSISEAPFSAAPQQVLPLSLHQRSHTVDPMASSTSLWMCLSMAVSMNITQFVQLCSACLCVMMYCSFESSHMLNSIGSDLHNHGTHKQHRSEEQSLHSLKPVNYPNTSTVCTRQMLFRICDTPKIGWPFELPWCAVQLIHMLAYISKNRHKGSTVYYCTFFTEVWNP